MKKVLLQKAAYTLASVLMILLFSIQTQAHFGSKGPYGGTITCSIVSADTVFMGTEEGGVYASTSPLLVGWRARPVGLKSGKVTALAHNGSNLYAATADSGIFVLNGYVGSDRYFNKINNGLTNLNVTSLIAINATTLMAGTTTGLFLTINNGVSWTEVNGDLHHLDVTAITKAGARIFITTGEGGVYATDNNGTTWFDFNDVNTEHISGTIALSYNATTDELMVLNSGGLFVASSASTAMVPSYTNVSTSLPSATAPSFISNDGATWYLATNNGVVTSASSLITWTTLNTGLPTLTIKTVVPFNSGLVCGTAKKGIAKAALPFSTWTVMNVGFNNIKTTAMVASGAALVVAATENGVFVSKDLAANYVAANNGLVDSLNVTDMIIAETALFASTINGGVYVSADTGRNWSPVNTGLFNLNIQRLFYAAQKVYAICSTGSVYVSSLSTINWTNIQTGLPSSVQPTSMVFYGDNILLGTLGDGVFVKKTYTNQWVAYNTGLTNVNVTSVAAMGTKIYAGTDGSGVFVSDSTTASINWIATAPTTISHTSMIGLDGSEIQAMATYAGYVWASYKGGLLATSNEGATWIAGGNQFNLPSYTDVLRINFVTTRAFVTTENNGLYSSALSELPAIVTGLFSASSTNNALLNIAPNPNNGSFELNVDAISGTVSDIVIYDIVGNLKGTFIATQTTFNLNYTPGMYVVLVKTDADAVYSQKIVIE